MKISDIKITGTCPDCGKEFTSALSQYDFMVTDEGCECCGPMYEVEFDVVCEHCGKRHEISTKG